MGMGTNVSPCVHSRLQCSFILDLWYKSAGKQTHLADFMPDNKHNCIALVHVWWL